MDLGTLTDDELAREIERREASYRRWRDVYWADCIPFAHGVRLFGQYYNDVVQPQNPYEFMDLLGGPPMLSLARNRDLEALARMVREAPTLGDAIRRGDRTGFPSAFSQALSAFVQEHGDVPASTAAGISSSFLTFLLELADAPSRGADTQRTRAEQLCNDLLAAVPESERSKAEEMLDLARASHRWRDDDNVYLDAIEALWNAAQDEQRRRTPSSEPPVGTTLVGTGENEQDIAREYGIPCVTGIPDAAERIRSGIRLTVDGYLGIVRVEPVAEGW